MINVQMVNLFLVKTESEAVKLEPGLAVSMVILIYGDAYTYVKVFSVLGIKIFAIQNNKK